MVLIVFQSLILAQLDINGMEIIALLILQLQLHQLHQLAYQDKFGMDILAFNPQETA